MAEAGDVELLNISVNDIEFGPRARRSYSGLAELADSFKKHGVIQPVAVQRQGGEGKKPFLLLAGGRRYSAAVFGDIELIPGRVYQDGLSELDRREIELAENIEALRHSLNTREEAWLTEEIHRLYQEKYGVAAGPSEGHSAADTARLLGVSAMTVSRNLKIARALRDTPEVLEGVKTQSDALRILKRAERLNEERGAAQKFDQLIQQDEGKEVKYRLASGFLLGDFFSLIEGVPDSAVNLVEIDPPYSISLKAIKKAPEESMQEYNEIEEAAYPSFLEDLFKACYRVMFPDSWLLCWFAIQWYTVVVEKLASAGLSPCHIPAVWVKGSAGQTQNPELRLGSAYEPMIYARKGQATIRKPGRSNVFMFQPVHQDKKIHPTERPVELMEDVLSTFAPPGAHILVPFLGSGNTLLAAANLGYTGFGMELSEVYKNAFLSRVVEGKPREYRSYGFGATEASIP